MVEDINLSYEECPHCHGTKGNSTCDYCLGFGEIIHCPEKQLIIEKNNFGLLPEKALKNNSKKE